MSTFTLTFLCNFKITIERIIPYGIGLSKLNRDNIIFKHSLVLRNNVPLLQRLYPLHRLLRKEVIQPQVLLRLPCYDFTPIIGPTFGRWLPYGLPHGLRVLQTLMV